MAASGYAPSGYAPSGYAPSGYAPSGYAPSIHHPEIMRSILAGIVETGVIGMDGPGRTVIAVTVDNWLIDELAALGSDLEDREREPDEEADGI